MLVAASPLAEAVETGSVELVRLLLDAGADPDGGLPCPVLVAAERNLLDMAKILLDAGASADCGDEEGTTALMFAADAGALDMAKLLVEHGANVDRRDRDDDAALISAAARAHSEVYDYLLPLTLDETIRKDAAEAYKPQRRRSRGRRRSAR